jgi:predicted transcriptional regulator
MQLLLIRDREPYQMISNTEKNYHFKINVFSTKFNISKNLPAIRLSTIAELISYLLSISGVRVK